MEWSMDYGTDQQLLGGMVGTWDTYSAEWSVSR